MIKFRGKVLIKVFDHNLKKETYIDFAEGQSGKMGRDFQAGGRFKCFHSKRKSRKDGIAPFLRKNDKGIFDKPKTGNLDSNKFRILSNVVNELRERGK